MKLLLKFLQTENSQSWGITFLRIFLGIIMLVTGLQKFGLGVEGVTGIMIKDGIPEQVAGFSALLIIGLELIGGLMLILGLGTRLIAFLYIGEFFVAGVLVSLLPEGWFVSRLPMLILGNSICLLFAGPGKLAIDNLLVKKTAR